MEGRVTHTCCDGGRAQRHFQSIVLGGMGACLWGLSLIHALFQQRETPAHNEQIDLGGGTLICSMAAV